ncbi:MAG: type VI secretion system-associated FHA domain protein TagH, partial [Acetobacteraceae bacterium]|nr:type VI secretion system-associated FHA domain protein TagH [Acetobacteraceae bacterium]
RPPPPGVTPAPLAPTAEVPPFALPEAEAPRGASPAPAALPPVTTLSRGPAPTPADPPPEALGDPFAEDGVPSRSIPDPESILPAAIAVAPAVAAPAPPQRPPLPLPPAAVDPGEALAALLRGAGIAPAALHGAATPLAVFEQAGAALRAAVAGLRALLIARADVKREFRIEQTMLRAAGNNPLKFAATDEAAMAALLTGGSQGVRAVAATVGDLTAHEVATLAATQAAAKALLGRLAPELVEESDSGGGLFGAREKRLWESYKRLHDKVVAQFEDDFDSAFGKEFARAYEQAVASRDIDGDGRR